MRTFRGATAVAAVLIAVGLAPSATAINPAVIYIGKFAAEQLTGAALSAAYDEISGKPNIRVIERRLRDLEESGVARVEFRSELDKLRMSINDRITRAEFEARVAETVARISETESRLSDLECRVERLEVESLDAKSGTNNATSSVYYVARGYTFRESNQILRALACYTIALDIDAGSVEAHKGRCAVYMEMGAAGIATASATLALEKVPSSEAPLFYYIRAAAYDKLKRERDVVADCSMILDAYSNQEVMRLRQRNATSVAKRMNAALGKSGAAARPVFDKAQLVALTSVRDKYAKIAYKDTSALILEAPGEASNYYDRAELVLMGPKPFDEAFEDAKKDVNTAIRLMPSESRYWARRARWWDDRKLVLQDLQAAHRLDPSNAEIINMRATQYDALGDEANAIADWEKAFELQPTAHTAFMLSRKYIKRDAEKCRHYESLWNELSKIEKMKDDEEYTDICIELAKFAQAK